MTASGIGIEMVKIPLLILFCKLFDSLKSRIPVKVEHWQGIHRPPWQREPPWPRTEAAQVAAFDGRNHTHRPEKLQTDRQSPSHAREKLLNRFIACPVELPPRPRAPRLRLFSLGEQE